MKKHDKFDVGDIIIQDCVMPYPNTMWRVVEMDEHGNWRGFPIVRLLVTKERKKVNTWFGYTNFRKVTPEEALVLFKDVMSVLRTVGVSIPDLIVSKLPPIVFEGDEWTADDVRAAVDIVSID